MAEPDTYSIMGEHALLQALFYEVPKVCLKLDTYRYDRNEQVFPQEVLLVQRGEEGRL